MIIACKNCGGKLTLKHTESYEVAENGSVSSLPEYKDWTLVCENDGCSKTNGENIHYSFSCDTYGRLISIQEI